MSSKNLTSRIASTSEDWAAKVEELYRILREMHGVVDVKFAFGSLGGKEPQQIYRAVAEALQAVLDNKVKEFKGLGDSYGLKP